MVGEGRKDAEKHLRVDEHLQQQRAQVADQRLHPEPRRAREQLDFLPGRDGVEYARGLLARLGGGDLPRAILVRGQPDGVVAEAELVLPSVALEDVAP